jgi:hypothetical protein
MLFLAVLVFSLFSFRRFWCLAALIYSDSGDLWVIVRSRDDKKEEAQKGRLVTLLPQSPKNRVIITACFYLLLGFRCSINKPNL